MRKGHTKYKNIKYYSVLCLVSFLIVGCGGGGNSNINGDANSNNSSNSEKSPVDYRAILAAATEGPLNNKVFMNSQDRSCNRYISGRSEKIKGIGLTFDQQLYMYVSTGDEVIDGFDLPKFPLKRFGVGYGFSYIGGARTSNLTLEEDAVNDQGKKLSISTDYSSQGIQFYNPKTGVSVDCDEIGISYSPGGINLSIPELAFNKVVEKKVQVSCTDNITKKTYSESIEIKSGRLLIGNEQVLLSAIQPSGGQSFIVEKLTDGSIGFQFRFSDGYFRGLIIESKYDSYGDLREFLYLRDAVKCIMA